MSCGVGLAGETLMGGKEDTCNTICNTLNNKELKKKKKREKHLSSPIMVFIFPSLLRSHPFPDVIHP